MNRLQRQAVRHLAQALAAREAAARAEAAARLEASLPPSTYVELIGQAAARQQITARLLADGAPWIVAVVGMGGLGKTALADAAAREAIKTLAFSRVVWLRVETPALAPGAISPEHLGQAILNDLAHQLGVDLPDGLGPHEHLARLRQVCKHEPLLVIIDNLEADADTVYLVEQLASLAGPTRFLLTARTPPVGQAAVYLHLIQELDRAEALRLLQQTAGHSGQHDLERAPEALLGEIHAVVGGNPLALKLVAGLLRVQSLRQILDDLQHHPRGEVEALYRRLYQRLWPTLSPAARAVLEAMPLAAAGGTTAEHLLAITELPPDTFWPALGELANRSLLEVRGSLQERRYSIHRMTELFIRLDIIDWRD